jgi:hypothetical protein
VVFFALFATFAFIVLGEPLPIQARRATGNGITAASAAIVGSPRIAPRRPTGYAGHCTT